MTSLQKAIDIIRDVLDNYKEYRDNWKAGSGREKFISATNELQSLVGPTVPKFAKEAGLTPSSIYRWFNHRSFPRLSTLKRLIRVLKPLDCIENIAQSFVPSKSLGNQLIKPQIRNGVAAILECDCFDELIIDQLMIMINASPVLLEVKICTGIIRALQAQKI